ncbi:hypothetical protein ES703_87537 [subsurface metagenome]
MKRLPIPFPNVAVEPQSAQRENPHRKLFLNFLFRYGDAGYAAIFVLEKLPQRFALYVKPEERGLRSSSKHNLTKEAKESFRK